MQKGYTVVELIVVMIVIGVLSVTTLPKFFGVSSFEEMGYLDTVTQSIRQAQKMAMSSGCDTRAEITISGYALWQRATDCTTGAFNRSVKQPGGTNWSGSTPGGLSVVGTDIYFDGNGRPYLLANPGDTSGTALASAITISIGGRQLQLEPETGYIFQL